MSTRRVVRSRLEKDSEIIPKKSFLRIIGSYLRSFFRILWCGLRVFWYWIERIGLVLLLIVLIGGLAWWLSHKPSNLRDWLPSEAILPEVSFSGNQVSIKNVRNHTWTTESLFIPGYYDTTFDLENIEGLYYIITPFSDNVGPAHTMLSFTFSGGQHIVISGEIRKERGESFDAWNGVLNQYELVYVIASEDDVIKLRTNYRKNEVYMYPIKVEKEQIQMLFRSMAIRADKLSKEPEFYNTLWNNCTTSILMHANALRDNKIGWNLYTLLPSHSDELVYSLGLIDTNLSVSEARAYYRVDELARSVSGEVSISDAIRKPRK